MPYIPHTEEEIKQMLEVIGVPSIDALFSEIPTHLAKTNLSNLPSGLDELSMHQFMQERANQDGLQQNFIGAGAYEHYIPSTVWSIASCGEWMTCYTPYQAEASQGTLQLLYEYQSMMTTLMQLAVSNASMYDGASAVAEAILMAMRCHSNKSNKYDKSDKDDNNIKNMKYDKNQENPYKILIPRTLHPYYRQVIKTLLSPHAVMMTEIPFDLTTGQMKQSEWEHYKKEKYNAILIAQPNFFGVLEDVDAWCDFAKEQNMMVIAVVNPITTAVLKPPGLWGKKGADIACGEGQPLGIPLSSGGPYFGFLTCKKEYIRQLPGRLVGRTKDNKGNIGFSLTLQAREQHIRRAKATSNICTNQGLLVTAATIYMSLLGPKGLQQVAEKSYENTHKLAGFLQNKNIPTLFQNSPYFHEFVIQLKKPVKEVLKALSQKSIQAGFDLSEHYPELGNVMLICATEVKTEADLKRYVHELDHCLEKVKVTTE